MTYLIEELSELDDLDEMRGGGRLATEAEAHVEWHINAGVPLGTPGCPQDACHPDDYHDEEEPMAPRLSTDRFHWDAASHTFSAEASDLGDPPPGRLYQDACDVGIILVSARTGREARFVYADSHVDREGDTQYWSYELVPEDRRALGLGDDVHVQIFND